MPRLSEKSYRELLGYRSKSKMTKEQIKKIETNLIPPDKVEYYFGRRCEYWLVDKIDAYVKSYKNF